MLVQNSVDGDSRVQKQAASAAAAGWEVILLGRSPVQEERSWRIGGAEVRLVHVRKGLARRRHELRAHWVRDPLAYPFGPLEAYRRRQLKAWRRDIGFRKDRIAVEAAERGAAVTRLRRLALLPRRVAVRAAGDWAALRSARTERLRERRKRMDGALDRFAIRFWSVVLGRRAWRRLDPALWDFELAFGPVVDALEPDLVHANDFQMLGVGARAVVRGRAEGRGIGLVWDVHEYLPGIKPWVDHPAWKPAQLAHEREFAHWADAVVTVSASLADLLVKRHRLAERPAVVLNVPDTEPGPDAASEASEPVPDIRARCGVGADTPLIVYSGAPMRRRGLVDVVEAMPELPGVHAAFVVNKPTWADVRLLEKRAAELGVADRVHVLPYVPHRQVVPFLAGADVGLIPIHHWLNHEIALITKFFEYSHARLPIVVSDVKEMAATVRRTGQGEVFRAEDPADLARAVRAVLDDPRRYRRAYAESVPLGDWTWTAQAAVLDEVYERVFTATRPQAPQDSSSSSPTPLSR